MKRISSFVVVSLVAVFAFVSSSQAYSTDYELLPGNGTRVPTDNATTKGPMTPPPSIDVRVPGTVTSVLPTIRFYSSLPSDLDIALEAPDHRYIILMSDVCSGGVPSTPFYFTDGGPAMNSDGTPCTGPSFKPTNSGSGDTFSTLTPGATPVSSLSSFENTPARGLWRFHIEDDALADESYFYSLELRLDTVVDPALGYTKIPAESTVALSKTITGARPIADVDAVVHELSDRYPENFDLFLQSPSGTVATLASDFCANRVVNGVDWTFDDEAPQVLPELGTTECYASPRSFKPSNFGAYADSIEDKSVLPNGSYPSQLSIFDGQNPTGTWRLIANANDSLADGYIKGFDLAVTMNGAKKVSPSTPKLKFKRSGNKIKATARVKFGGDRPTAAECGGRATTEFQRKTVRRKKGKKLTVYKRVVKSSSPITFKAGRCGYDIAAKLPSSYRGKKLRLQTRYLGGDYIAPFTKTTDVKIK